MASSIESDQDKAEKKRSSWRDMPFIAGDRLVFKTHKDELLALNENSGLSFQEEQVATSKNTKTPHQIIEAVVSFSSRFAGKRPTDLKLRRRYRCFIMAIHRDKQNITRHFDQVRLRPGDVILLSGSEEDLERMFEQEGILSMSEFKRVRLNKEKAILSMLTLASVIGLAAFNVMSIAGLAIVGAMLLILTGCVTMDKAYQAIEWRILMIIFGTLSLSIAMENTGLAEMIVTNLLALVKTLGPTAILAMIYLITSLPYQILRIL